VSAASHFLNNGFEPLYETQQPCVNSRFRHYVHRSEGKTQPAGRQGAATNARVALCRRRSFDLPEVTP